jgi:hypothetical protein
VHLMPFFVWIHLLFLIYSLYKRKRKEEEW